MGKRLLSNNKKRNWQQEDSMELKKNRRKELDRIQNKRDGRGKSRKERDTVRGGFLAVSRL